MLDARVRKIVSTSAPDEPIAFLVDINADSEMSRLGEIDDDMERRTALKDLSARAKAPVIEALNGYRDQGISIVNPLNGSLQLIAEGPAQAWQQALGDHADIFNGEDVDLVPNTARFSTQT